MMENNLINAFNGMNNTSYSSIEEIQERIYYKNTSRIGNFRE